MWSVPLLLLLPICSARGGPGDESDDDGHWKLTFAPAKVQYPAYVADQRRPTFALSVIKTHDSDIEAVSDLLFGIRMGVRFALLQLHPEGDPDGGLQLAGDVAYFGQFDWRNSTDNVGWDGLFSFFLSWLPLPELALRAGMSHFSSHLGDEYIEKTGRQRIEYTREEILAGLRYTPKEYVSGYVEYGHAYDLRNEELMEEGRAEFGLEWQPKPMIWDDRLAPFAALDVSTYQENDWDDNLTVQVGIVRPGAGRGGAWRLGVEYYDGRSALGEFFLEEEQHLAVGLWLDL